MEAKQGDTIRWSFEPDHPFKPCAGKTFEAEVVFVDEDGEDYAVYADYGQDYIPFDKAEIVKPCSHYFPATRTGYMDCEFCGEKHPSKLTIDKRN